MLPSTLESYIDLQVMQPDAGRKDILSACDEARRHGYCSVVVSPLHVRLASEALWDSLVLVCAMIGFPFGALPTEVKAYETRWAISDGAQEIEVVMPIGSMCEDGDAVVQMDIEAVRAECPNAILKVVPEMSFLSLDQRRRASRIARAAGAQFLSISTGYSAHRSEPSDIQVIRDAVGSDVGIKVIADASHLRSARILKAAGADRVGVRQSPPERRFERVQL